MKFFTVTGVLILSSGLLAAQQAGQAANDSGKAGIADEMKQLRDAFAQQQQQMAEQQKQMAEQQKFMQEQQQQIVREQEEIEKLRSQMAAHDASSGTAAPQLVNAAMTNAPNAASASISDFQSDRPRESPLSFRIGGMDFTPGGFVELENVF